MIASLKSELRKLLTVRMTYFVTLIGFLITGGLMSFYSMGMMDAAEGGQNPQYMEGVILNNANFMAIFIAIVALLMVTHEYRYNTIMHTLTSSSSRTKTFIAKMIVIAGFALVVTAFVSVVGPLLALLGMSVKGVELGPQTILYLDAAWRCLYYGFAMAAFAAIIAFIVRNQVGAIITFFIVINTAEGLLGMLLKDNVKYLPFTSLQHVINVTARNGSPPEGIGQIGYLSPSHAALLVTGYLTVGGVVAWLLFVRRDAN